MQKYTRLPEISGKKLIKLLQKDNWIVMRQAKHGVALAKHLESRTRVTIIPNSNARLDDGTLSAILGNKQTCIGKQGLLALINRYGL